MTDSDRKPDPPCPYITGTVTRYCTLTPFTITAAEREAVRFFSQIDGPHNVPVANKRAATLRGLLERLGAANSGEDRRSGGGEHARSGASHERLNYTAGLGSDVSCIGWFCGEH